MLHFDEKCCSWPLSINTKNSLLLLIGRSAGASFAKTSAGHEYNLAKLMEKFPWQHAANFMLDHFFFCFKNDAIAFVGPECYQTKCLSAHI